MRSLAIAAALCAIAEAQVEGLGRISFPTSGSPAAQKHFLRGLLWLHSFEYRDARSAFQEARKAEPGFHMAYWGEAMTYNEPLWFAQDRAAARVVLDAARRLPPAPAARERDYLQTVEILFGEAAKESRDFAYAAAMERLHETYPDDDEAAAFHALAVIGTCHRGRDVRLYMRAAAIVEEVFARNPQHPGALHYLIHCYDDPVHAPLGLRAARLYPKVAAHAPHALHMPSHIFFALGKWEEAAASNHEAWKASRSRLDPGGYHAWWWLVYARLQQGRYEAARALRQPGNDTSPLARFHHVMTRAAIAIETGEPYSGGVVTDALDLPALAADRLASGLSAFYHGNRSDAGVALAGLRSLRVRAAGAPRHLHGHPYPGDTQVVEIAEQELAATLLMADGRSREAVDAMKRAVAVEDKMPIEFGPPMPPKPAHEMLGEMLLELNQPRLAKVQFEIALRRAPGRALSLLGLARSQAAMGEKIAARAAYGVLDTQWAGADHAVREALRGGMAKLE